MRSGQLFFARPGLCLMYAKRWLSLDASNQFMKILASDLDWVQGSLQIFGRTIPEPRLTAWCGEFDYTYSRRRLEAMSWHPQLKSLRGRLEFECHQFGLSPPDGLNHCLLNYYRGGSDSMGWHRDNEPELGQDPVIVSVSLGAGRRFSLRPRQKSNQSTLQFELGCGDLLVMYGRTQSDWEHSLMKTSKSIGPRINLTFRSVVGK